MRTLIVTLSSMLLAFGCLAKAEDDVVFSGPQVGEKLPPLKVITAYEEPERVVDLAGTPAGEPVLLVVVNGANRPAANLTRVLMNYAEMRADDGLSAGVVWLDDDRTEALQYLRRAISWWGAGPPVGVSVEGAEGPGSYGLNRNVNLTILIADQNQVTANFALIQPSETDAPGILREVVKLVGGEVPSMAELSLLSMPTRKPANAKWHAAPQDVHLRQLLCSLLSARDDAAADSAAQAIEGYVRGHADRAASLAQVAERLCSGRTNVGAIPAARYLQSWVAESRPQR